MKFTQFKEHLSVADGVCTFRPRGQASLVATVDMITDVIAHCRSQRLSKLLVDVREVHGYSVPTLADRYWMVQDWAQAAQGTLILAMVALPEYIHPEKFGVKAAADAGLKGDVFTAVADANAWLADNSPDAAAKTGEKTADRAVPE